MTIMFGILLVTWTLCCTCLAIPDVHKQMTVNQLQSIFHVDNIDLVPDYELIKLLHEGSSGNNDDNSRSNRRKRSINNQMSKNIHHIKKDLSKTPYFSDIKNLTEQNSGNSISDLSDINKIKNLDLSDIKEHNVSFSAFGDLLNLTLKQTDGLFKNGPESLRMWMVRSEPNSTQGLEYDEIDESTANQQDEEIGEVFQDEDNMAAILMRRQLQTGDLIMEGSIGHALVIKPLPHELSPNKEEVHHIVYKRSVEATESLSDFAYMEPDRLEKRYREKRSTSQFDSSHSGKTKWTERDDDDDLIASSSNINRRSRRAAPYIIYPEILVIVDYDGYRLHGGDNVQVKRYFVSFWNGVDLRYRLLKGPRIRISIAGIIISRGRDATPYLERNRVGRDAIDSAAALTDMGKYLFRERRLPVYDIAVAITKLDMCRRNYAYGECKRGTAGFAYVGGACVVNKRLEKVNSVAIIEDTGGFSGIIVAAHEVGHLLGAVHDGSPPPSYLGGPGAQKCRWEDGYIMSDLRHTERGFRWSPCTIQSFHHFLNGDTASCLHNAPHEDSALGRALPGTLLSLDAQCRRDRGTYACFKDDRVCAQLFCFDSQTGYCVAYRPAAEGSSCGSGVHCLDGRCVAAHTASAYTQHVYRQAYNNEDEDENEDDEEEDEEDDDDEDDDDDYNESTPKSLTIDNTQLFTNPTTPTTTSIPLTTTTITTPTIISSSEPTTICTSVPVITNTPTIIHSSTTQTTTLKIDEILSPMTTTKRPTNLNPFYYGISKLKSHLEQQQQHNTNNTTTLTTINLNNRNRNLSNKQLSLKPVIRKPFDYYLNLYNIKYRNSHSSNSPYYSSSTTTPPTTIATTTTQTPIILSTTIGTTLSKKLHEINGNYDNINDDNIDNNHNNNNNDDDDPDFGLKFNINNNNNNSPTTQRSYIFGGRSTTRSSFFDTYFRKLTTKTPNLDHFGKYFRRINVSSSSSSSSSSNNNNNNNNNDNNNHSSVQQQQQQLQLQQPVTPPSYSSNYLGDNSNYLPVNVSATER